MKWNKNSLKVKVWLYLILFSTIILAFLWLFQVFFINAYYEYDKTQTLHTATNKLKNVLLSIENKDEINTIARDYGICIEITTDTNSYYVSDVFNKGCMMDYKGNSALSYRQEFIMSGESEQSYMLINPRFNNKTLVNAVNLGNGYYGFISASLEPLDTTIILLKKQLFYISFVVLLLAFVIAYFISKKLSKPIEKMNKTAKKMAEGDYHITYETKNGISEIDELANTLNYANAELGKTDELRRELLANVSHDLKTPLTMIKAYAEMVRDLTYKNKVKRNENLNVIIEESDRLNLLVNDILTLSSMQSKTVELQKETFNLAEMIYSIIKKYDILADKEDYRFIIDCPDNVEIYADKKKIEQVIYNLINNAIHYTSNDKTITIRILKKSTTRIEIIDTGKGITKEELPFIWDKYYHTEKNHQRNIVGTGLGLSIVKTILISHHFTYGVTSKKGKGTTFYFETPIPKEDNSI